MPQAPHSPLVLCRIYSLALGAASILWPQVSVWRGSGPPSSVEALPLEAENHWGGTSRSEWVTRTPYIRASSYITVPACADNCTAMSGFYGCTGEGVPASSRFPLAFLYNIPTTAGCCSTHLLQVLLLVYVTLTDLLLFGVWWTKAVKHGHPGRDRLPLRDTLKCSLINTTSKIKLSIVLTFYPELSGRWPLWLHPCPQFPTIHDTLYYFIKLYNRNKSFIENVFSNI